MKYKEGIFITTDDMMPISLIKKEDKIVLSDGTITEVLFISAVIGDNDAFESAKKIPLCNLIFTIFLETLKGDFHVVGGCLTDIPGDTMVSCWLRADSIETGSNS